MAALVPLAIITLLATASLSAPATALFRATRRAQPEHPPVEDNAEPSLDSQLQPNDAPIVEPRSILAALLGHAAAVVLASIRLTTPTTISQPLPASDEPQKTRVSIAQDGESVSVETMLASQANDQVQVRPDTPRPLDTANPPPLPATFPVFAPVVGPTLTTAPSRRSVLQPSPSHHGVQLWPPHVGQRNLPPYSVDMNISWEEIWPSPRQTLGNSAKTMSTNSMTLVWSDPPTRQFVPKDENDDDDNTCGSSSDMDSDSDMEDAFDLVQRLDDDDLISALQALSLSEITAAKTKPQLSSAQIQAFLASLPPAGISPFCPPPTPTPPPPQPASTTVTWRLDWC
ncbi:hypothetical protein MIND_01174300 [Mycena indigotica]|uniref:Uncharacterized protein n=1 Tax=Mycena indigotica TaxID=2126181 RepID=A0A8H6VWI9_9AGAR|nr:uncharacterized protein MIND_01174300 [Mycena indigotica]KAF7292758.1 hypothetical protein MIND_01174300 [Mycena indigotica]